MALCALAMSAGCASTMATSERNAAQPRALRTINYALPQTHLTFSVIEDASGAPDGLPAGTRRFTTVDAEPALLYDERLQYTLQYLPSGASDDDITVETDDNGFLKSLTLNREDRTADIIEDASSLLRTLASGLPSGQRAANAHWTSIRTIRRHFKA
jgi:hypothetical protein